MDYEAISESIFNDELNILATELELISDSSFERSTFNKGIDFTNLSKLKRIDRYAFNRSIIKEKFILPQTIQIIDTSAFYKTELPEGFTLANQNDLVAINHWAFFESKLPSSFALPDNSSLKIENDAFEHAEFSDGFIIPASITENEAKFAFDDYPVGGSWVDANDNTLTTAMPGAIFRAD